MPKVYVSSVINANADSVWSHVRDFNALPRWVPLVRSSRIEGNLSSDQIGCVRAFETRDGGKLREKLLALSDYDYACTYAILESPMGVSDYVATMKFTPITDGDRTFAEWTAEFDCEPARAEELVDFIGQTVFQAAFDNLRKQLDRQ